MIAPVIAGVAALYGWYRYKKSKDQAALDAALTTPKAPVIPPGYAAPARTTPTVTQAKSMLAAVQSVQAAKAGLGAPLPPAYGAGATTVDVPPGRIPSSLYGAGGPGDAQPIVASGAGVQVTADANLKFKI